MNDTVKLILSLSLSGSILAGLIFTVKLLFKHKLSKSIQYYLWIVVLFRFMLPFSFEGSITNIKTNVRGRKLSECGPTGGQPGRQYKQFILIAQCSKKRS
ncbi:M56 family metallopeptidase [Desulfoscipio gibsoniae]|uniref:BlaR1 peptidase M56 n=1 Tax=Desulfoscipio gibsoniae DSM 7213 TaxID=767817 RepID=R4KKZ3_9FIRM|nr:M56 family metallopeptidase [Desulfoscipio gibsoniae]AGL03329.1 BlaR1 peptidase M56 [Desulfoscipio gibsoniae DSM 7213]